ncbi:MAG: hypothetical protein K2Q20_01285 [Phycisphaerales bacterium]|nr:hypothetical protein [Phycisphaerales bacterium]
MTVLKGNLVKVFLEDGSVLTGSIFRGEIVPPKTMGISQFGETVQQITVEPARCQLELVNLQVETAPITITPPKPARLPADAEDPAWGIF